MYKYRINLLPIKKSSMRHEVIDYALALDHIYGRFLLHPPPASKSIEQSTYCTKKNEVDWYIVGTRILLYRIADQPTHNPHGGGGFMAGTDFSADFSAKAKLAGGGTVTKAKDLSG